MKAGDLVKMLYPSDTQEEGELGVIIGGPFHVGNKYVFYDVMFSDGLDFLKDSWMGVVDEKR